MRGCICERNGIQCDYPLLMYEGSQLVIKQILHMYKNKLGYHCVMFGFKLRSFSCIFRLDLLIYMMHAWLQDLQPTHAHLHNDQIFILIASIKYTYTHV